MNYETDNYIVKGEKSSYKNALLFIIMIIITFFVGIYLIIKIPESIDKGYSLLFTLPITFTVFLLLTHNCWEEMPSNIGLTLLFVIEFIRLVISPALIAISGYYNVIEYNAIDNNSMGILLLIYETFWIGIAVILKAKNKINNFENIDNKKSNTKMTSLIMITLFITIIVCYFAPEILKNYRLINGLFTDEQYTNIEQSYIVNKYATNTFKKLMLILANYILKVVRIILPTYLMIQLKKSNTKLSKILSVILIISPFLFVDGAIARSLYLTLFLLLIYNHLYGIDVKKLYFPISFAIILVIIYFGARYKLSGSKDFLLYMADKSVDYFAGVNIIGGSCNLPDEIKYRFHYFTLDLLRSIPFSNTFFGLNSNDYIQSFFNKYNILDGGQIPTTIGMGYYYFSFLFAPIYSILFARMCKKYGQKAIKQENPYYKLVYYYLSFIFSLGIGMYNIEITLGTIVQIILPIYLITRISYRKVDEKNSDT